jgi:hypothetical protein
LFHPVPRNTVFYLTFLLFSINSTYINEKEGEGEREGEGKGNEGGRERERQNEYGEMLGARSGNLTRSLWLNRILTGSGIASAPRLSLRF